MLYTRTFKVTILEISRLRARTPMDRLCFGSEPMVDTGSETRDPTKSTARRTWHRLINNTQLRHLFKQTL